MLGWHTVRNDTQNKRGNHTSTCSCREMISKMEQENVQQMYRRQNTKDCVGQRKYLVL